MTKVKFQELFASPLRNGVSYPARSRGSGIPMINMGEAFAYDRISDEKCERVPLTKKEKESFLLREGDLLFVRQSLAFKGAGKCILVLKSEEDRTWESHLTRARLDESKAFPTFYFYFFNSPAGRKLIETIIEQVAAAGIRGSELAKLPVPLPALATQRAIAEVLGALDDKIAANDRTQQVAGEFARALFDRAAKSGVKHIVRDVATLVARGVAPKYTDNNGITVLNQKCVRDQWVSVEPARGTLSSSVRENKLLRQHDVLVNSTGFGTLGRVARWARKMDATVDSHISIVRFDGNIVDPVCAGFGLLRLEKQIESLAEGSTGQTELRRDLLAGLEILVPSKEEQGAVGAELAALDAHALALEDENHRLSTTRDELLPLLMSGKLRVREAEKVVEEVV